MKKLGKGIKNFKNLNIKSKYWNFLRKAEMEQRRKQEEQERKRLEEEDRKAALVLQVFLIYF